MPPPMDYPIMRNVPTEVETTHIYRCKYCGETTRETYLGWTFMAPGWPTGWVHYAPGIWVCPKHEVKITVDGNAEGA